VLLYKIKPLLFRFQWSIYVFEISNLTLKIVMVSLKVFPKCHIKCFFNLVEIQRKCLLFLVANTARQGKENLSLVHFDFKNVCLCNHQQLVSFCFYQVTGCTVVHIFSMHLLAVRLWTWDFWGDWGLDGSPNQLSLKIPFKWGLLNISLHLM